MKRTLQNLYASVHGLFHNREPLRRCRSRRMRPLLEVLEDRSVPATFALDNVLATFNEGAAAMRQQTLAIAGETAKVDIPILNESLGDAVRTAGKLNSAFNIVLAGNAISSLRMPSNFTMLASTTEGDEGDNLLRVRYQIVANNEAASSMTVGGDVGMFDKSYVANGGVVGELTGRFNGTSGRIVTEVILGVDVRGGAPTFYVDAGDWLTVSTSARPRRESAASSSGWAGCSTSASPAAAPKSAILTPGCRSPTSMPTADFGWRTCKRNWRMWPPGMSTAPSACRCRP